MSSSEECYLYEEGRSHAAEMGSLQLDQLIWGADDLRTMLVPGYALEMPWMPGVPGGLAPGA